MKNFKDSKYPWEGDMNNYTLMVEGIQLLRTLQ